MFYIQVGIYIKKYQASTIIKFGYFLSDFQQLSVYLCENVLGE